MTTKENKLIQLFYPNVQWKLGQEDCLDRAERCVEIAEEFAIEFAFYLSDNYTSRTLDTWDDAVGIRFTTNEVLQVYKKEKGL